MLKNSWGPRYDIPANRRIKDFFQHKPKAIPRDVGEIPRNYILRFVYFNQPITSMGLWELMKKQADCPFDSKHHLQLVMKFARLDGWIYFEINQDSNQWVCNLTRERYNDVQALVTQHRDDERNKEDERQTRLAKEKEKEATEKIQNDDSYADFLHQELLLAAERLRSHNEEAYAALPFVDKGGYNIAWYEKANVNEA